MNREMRRRLKQNDLQQRQITPFSHDKLAEHIKLRKALDEGIRLGFLTAINLFESTAKTVSGIGDTRVAKIRQAFEAKLKQIEEEIDKENNN